MAVTAKQLAKMVDATVISADATMKDMEFLVEQGKKHEFNVIVGLQCYTPWLVEQTRGTDIKVLGAAGMAGVEPTDVKLFMEKRCIEIGCREMESFLNVNWLKSGQYDDIVKETRAIRELAKDMTYKVILETPQLNDEQIATACDRLIDSGVDFVKTGTGWWGATDVHTIEVMAKAVKGRTGMKASGGIRTLETIEAMMDLGVTRFGMGLGSLLKVMEEAGD